MVISCLVALFVLFPAERQKSLCFPQTHLPYSSQSSGSPSRQVIFKQIFTLLYKLLGLWFYFDLDNLTARMWKRLFFNRFRFHIYRFRFHYQKTTVDLSKFVIYYSQIVTINTKVVKTSKRSKNKSKQSKRQRR